MTPLPSALAPEAEELNLDALLTPAAVADLDRLEANLDRLAAYAAEHGIRLRPHVKTHKAPWIAAQQVERGAIGVTVATPREAELMAAVADDILVAYPTVDPARARAVAEVATRVRITVALDSEEAVRRLSAAVLDAGAGAAVLVEIDPGMKRCGVATPDAAVTLARVIADTPGLEYRGTMFYPGHIRGHVDEQGDDVAALSERLGAFIHALEDAGLAPGTVSGGSTPTWRRTHEMGGVTEMRPGTYVYLDRDQVGMGVCDWGDCAYSVLTTVISTTIPGQAVIDAGAKALSADGVRAAGMDGYGTVMGHHEVTVARKSEEHGILDLGRSDWRPAVGDRVRIIPNQACVSVNLHPRVYGLRGHRVVQSWPNMAHGWKPQDTS